MKAQEKGEFVVAEVPIPRERVRDVVSFSFEPLTIAFDVRVHK